MFRDVGVPSEDMLWRKVTNKIITLSSLGNLNKPVWIFEFRRMHRI